MTDKDALALAVHPQAVYEHRMRRKVRYSDVAGKDELSLRPGDSRLGLPDYVRVQVQLDSREGLKIAAKVLAELAEHLKHISGRSRTKEILALHEAYSAVYRANAQMRLSVPIRRSNSDADLTEEPETDTTISSS